jgi:hypothetical protein
VLAPLLPPVLFLPTLVTLRFSFPLLRDDLTRVFGATITSASGDIFAKGDVEGGAGVREVTIIVAVDVGER